MVQHPLGLFFDGLSVSTTSKPRPLSLIRCTGPRNAGTKGAWCFSTVATRKVLPFLPLIRYAGNLVDANGKPLSGELLSRCSQDQRKSAERKCLCSTTEQRATYTSSNSHLYKNANAFLDDRYSSTAHAILPRRQRRPHDPGLAICGSKTHPLVAAGFHLPVETSGKLGQVESVG